MHSERALVAVLLFSLSASAEPLLGAGVGNADTFVSEGTKLFNRKQYAKAASEFLKATRASPTSLATYVQLARASMLGKEQQRACYAYRVYLKATTQDSPDRRKAAAESELCERQVKPSPVQAALLQKYVDVRAAFFASLDQGELLGPDGAAASLRTLVKEGFLGPELADMGQKLAAAATAAADLVHKRALAGDQLPGEVLRSARPLYQVAADVGVSSPDARGRMAYLDGLAELGEKNFKKAELHFAEAARSDPSNKEYVFARAQAVFQGGERAAALKVLEGDLKDDPRTAVLRAALSVGRSPGFGAEELEQLLFTTRFPPEK
jgi:tetratricopeptide (TPR) repeat protein